MLRAHRPFYRRSRRKTAVNAAQSNRGIGEDLGIASTEDALLLYDAG